MWWLFVKMVEDASAVVYEYGYESKELTGMIKYNKKSKVITLTKLAAGDYEKDPSGVNKFYALTRERFSEKKEIAPPWKTPPRPAWRVLDGFRVSHKGVR
ncbi:hypothetical protein LQZ19_02655 [Treponema primitia]|uniref:hypothetical protein n=1 Tax=Treponema primitia TaxID=88058 RepID=UPI0039807F48